MSISLTPDQKRFIQTKLQAGKYRSAEEVLEIALWLLDEYDRSEAEINLNSDPQAQIKKTPGTSQIIT